MSIYMLGRKFDLQAEIKQNVDTDLKTKEQCGGFLRIAVLREVSAASGGSGI